MPKLTPEASQILNEVLPTLEQHAREITRKVRADLQGPVVEQATAVSTDRQSGVVEVTTDTGGRVFADSASFHPKLGERVWVEFSAGGQARVTGRVRGQPGLLGFAQTTTDVPIDAASGGYTILSVLAAVQPGRIIRCSAHIGLVEETAGGAQATSAWLADGGVLQATIARRDLIGLGSQEMDGHVPLWGLAAGPHTFTLVTFMEFGTGLVRATALGTEPGPATLTVEDIGSAATLG